MKHLIYHECYSLGHTGPEFILSVLYQIQFIANYDTYSSALRDGAPATFYLPANQLFGTSDQDRRVAL